jgi:hypothetical protein
VTYKNLEKWYDELQEYCKVGRCVLQPCNTDVSVCGSCVPGQSTAATGMLQKALPWSYLGDIDRKIQCSAVLSKSLERHIQENLGGLP